MLAISDLTVGYNASPILHQLSLQVKAGEILAIIGPNGAGKSTLVRAISGVLPVQCGRIEYDGLDLSRLSVPQRARYIAVVPQARDLPAAFTVYETVLLGRTPHLGWLGQTSAADHARTRWALELTHTETLASRRVGELSGGEQQRVLLARALAQQAPVLLLDEPTTHLDLQHQSQILNLVQSLAHPAADQLPTLQPLAVLMVLHDLNLAALYADRVAILNQGRIHRVGLPKEILTPETLTEVYHVPVAVITHPQYGTPLVLPDGRQPLPPSATPLQSLPQDQQPQTGQRQPTDQSQHQIVR